MRGVRYIGRAVVLMAIALLLLGVLPVLRIAPSAAETTATTHTYASTGAVIANPDRGFYKYTETHARPDGSGDAPLDPVALARWRTDQQITLVYRIFYLEAYVSRDTLDAGYLDRVAADLAAARAAGVRLVVRFAYSADSSLDAPAGRAVGHISQLAPVLNASADVIAVLQAGFVGRWGEWYYSDRYASDPARPWLLSDADWSARRTVLMALLDSTDPGMRVQVRYPGVKQRLLPESDARAARVGVHDDCFLGSADDDGTFPLASDRGWLAEQSRSTPVGGETCRTNSPRSDWPSASADLATYHWSFLNIDYEPGVLASWGQSGRDEAARRLGARLRLVSATLPTSVTAGGTATVDVTLVNDGYAAPLRARPVRLVMQSAGTTRVVDLPLDVRTLAPGRPLTVAAQVRAPSTTGTYALFLALPDAAAVLASRPAYAIRLANAGLWDAATGRNDLQHTLRVDASGPGTAPPSTPLSSITPTGVVNGWGPPERDRSNGEAAAGDGRVLSLRGQQFTTGLGTHAAAEQTFDLAGRFGRFAATVGVDDETAGRGSVVFEVYLDGARLYRSAVLTGTSAPVRVDVPVTAGRSMRLIVLDGGDGIAYDHADWALASLQG